ncbi:MAG: molybdopterin dinucleotide binding domain-containing protein, partial [Candidatus Bipolaricaulia bacterium]
KMAMWVHFANPVMSAMPQDVVIEGLSRLGLMVVVDPFLSETADLCADYVLPAATIDKLEGPLGGHTGYEKVSLIRFPVVSPMFQSKPDAEIYIDLAEKLGILKKYVETLNNKLKLPEELKLDPAKRPSLEEALDRWARSKGKSLQWFRENGVLVKPMPVNQRYAYLWDPPYGGVKHAFYSEVLVRLGRTVRERGLTPEEFPFVQDYTAYPTWREPTMFASPPEYDLILCSFKKIEHKQSRSANNAILNAMDPASYVRMHPETARAKGIRDGDEVWVESRNALTDETRRVKGRAELTQGVMPGVMAIAHHHGNWSHPITKGRDQGVSPNVLFPSGPGYVTLTGDQAFQVMVKVSKA